MVALGALGFVLLLAHGAAHVVLCGAIARLQAWRGAVAFVLPPLGVVWGWELGCKRAVIAYGATLTAFALGLVLVRVLG
jgi:hypothetical protein